MSALYHLRLDTRKVQDYIFQVPKLKFMLGANSKLGELFNVKLPNLMDTPCCVFRDEQLERIADEEVLALFRKNILSSSGGHFEAVFSSFEELQSYIVKSNSVITREIPDLEYSVSWREFDSCDTYDQFSSRRIRQINSSQSSKGWIDLPYYNLCNQDGVSIAMEENLGSTRQNEHIGTKASLMNLQADRFYRCEAGDSISSIYKSLGVNFHNLADTLNDLAIGGVSAKDNMLAYIKVDGNGTGARFRSMRQQLGNTSNVMDAFVKVESFWAANRNKLHDSLIKTLSDAYVCKFCANKLPYLLLMLGGDDLFLVCIPDLALHIACSFAENMGELFPVSVGIAYVKSSYPIGLANHLAESCLESAKAASYRYDDKPAYIDWHVHFDSVFQDISDIRRSAYMLNYVKDKVKVTEILSSRPYRAADTRAILNEVMEMAEMLDDPKKEAANNKIKGYRSVIKNGGLETDFFTKMLLVGDSYEKLKGFIGESTVVSRDDDSEIILNAALDKIELLDFYRQNKGKEGA